LQLLEAASENSDISRLFAVFAREMERAQAKGPDFRLSMLAIFGWIVGEV
jgi:hypothetical protein